jgi:hypothetical protein
VAENRFENWQPSKTLWFWSTLGTVVVVLILGFTWGGWTLGSTAREMAQTAADDAQEQLAAAFCVKRFMAGADVGAELVALKDESSWRRGEFVEKGGWAAMPIEEIDTDDVADLCAEQLAEMEAPPAADIDATQASAETPAGTAIPAEGTVETKASETIVQ